MSGGGGGFVVPATVRLLRLNFVAFAHFSATTPARLELASAVEGGQVVGNQVGKGVDLRCIDLHELCVDRRNDAGGRRDLHSCGGAGALLAPPAVGLPTGS